MTIDQKNINDFLYRLYQDVSCGALSVECRKKYNEYDQNCFVYGDSHLPSLYDIFNEVKPKVGEVFYDLGSGGGRVVLFALLSFPFAKGVGVELLDDLANLAKTKLKLMQERLPSLAGFDLKRFGEVEFIQDDFTKVDFSDAGVIYAASTCFDEKLMNKLAQSLENQVAFGARIITCTKKLPSDKFKVIHSQLYPMEWGQVNVFFHQRV